MGAFLRELVFRIMYTLFPGGGLTLSEWEHFGTSMIWCTIVAAGIAWIVLMITVRFQLVHSPHTVWKLDKPYRWGITTVWIVILLWAVLYIIITFAPLGKAKAFFHPNTFVFSAISGLLSWALYAVLASLACRWATMRRYRYVTFINRLLARRS